MMAPTRLPFIPAPFLDETFGSWFGRCADAYRTGKTDLLESILKRMGDEPAQFPIDWDTSPPRTLLKALSALTYLRESELEYLVVRPGPATLPRAYRDGYCPTCFKIDTVQEAVRLRREWLDSWTISCGLHRCLLGRFIPKDICLVDTRWQKAQATSSVQSIEARTVKLSPTDSINSYCTLVSNWFDPDMLKEIVGRDLFLVAGSEHATCLHEKVFGHFRRRRQVWHDDAGITLSCPELVHPIANIDVRVAAAHLAGLVWHCFRGTAVCQPYRTLIVEAMQNSYWTTPDDPWMIQITDRWPRDDRERWRKVFL